MWVPLDVLAMVALARTAPAPNYDLRDDRSGRARAVVEALVESCDPSGSPGWNDADAGRDDARVRSIREAADRLAAAVPALEVTRDAQLGGTEIVGVRAGHGFLTPPSTRPREETLRRFLDAQAALYGLDAGSAAAPRPRAGGHGVALVRVADYENPAGNLSWVELRQEIDAIPVFQAELRAVFTREGEIARTVGRLVPAARACLGRWSPDGGAGADAPHPVPAREMLAAARAVTVAAASVGVRLEADTLVATAISGDGRRAVFAAGPFVRPIEVEPRYFPLGNGVIVPAWSMILWEDTWAYWALVDAHGFELLWRKNLTEEQTQSATYAIYDDDSPAPLSPTSAAPGSGVQGGAISRSSITLVSELAAFDDLGWIADGGNTTTGNNVDAGLDLAPPDGIDPGGRPSGSPFRVFDFSYNPAPGLPPPGEAPTLAEYRAGEVTNLFFWSNRYHDRLYALGFTEAARNFQQDNFGRGGLGGDVVRAEAQDYTSTNNANFATGPDGTPGRMQMFLFNRTSPNRAGGLDQHLVLHELTHGTSARLHADASGLTATMSRGMGEGWSDFYALALLARPEDDPLGVYPYAPWAVFEVLSGYTDNYYYGGRRFPYAVRTSVGPNGKAHQPVTLADIDPAQLDLTDGAHPRGPIGSATAFQVHNIGEVWCGALWEVRARILERMGFASGSPRVLQIVTDGMKLDPINPTLLQGRDAILAADCAGFAGEDEIDIWSGFAARGMGRGAAVDSASSSAVVEAFDLPRLSLGPIGVSEAPGNGNGVPEPGETLALEIPLRSPFCGHVVAEASASVGGAVPAPYGAIPPGATVTRSLAYTVPNEAACGSALAVPVAIDGSLGAASESFTLDVGSRVVLGEGFDAVAAPALPPGWTAAVAAGSAANAWSTVAVGPWTSPNAAFAPDPVGVHDLRLETPAIPIAGASARLAFRHRYDTEAGFDGGVLEIAIGGGPFTDVLEAGGSFRTGGYVRALSACCGNPLGGRASWSGSSIDWIETIVDLPAAAAGSTIRARWRFGSDNVVGGQGWRVDAVSLFDGATCVTEACNDLDDDGDGLVDEGCDDDGDGRCDARMTVVGAPAVCPAGGGDCADDDPATRRAPFEVAGLRLERAAGSALLHFDSQDLDAGAATVYDVVSGSLGDLLADGGFSRAACLGIVPDTPAEDAAAGPAAREGRYYLVRARNACGAGTHGDSSASPDPRDALDAAGPCP